jgi:hypothetical protein
MKRLWFVLPVIALTSMFVAPAVASAAPIPSAAPQTARGCTVDTCIWLGNVTNGKITVHACAWKTGFIGTFEIIRGGPNGTYLKESPSKFWAKTSNYCTGSDQHFSYTSTSYKGKQYCASGVSDILQNEGTPCETDEG